MSEDARFEDGGERPINIGAMDGEEVQILSALCQDAVFPATEMSWHAAERRFGLLLNRFRWERGGAFKEDLPERVQSVLVVENVRKVASSGVTPKDRDAVYALLSITHEAGEHGDVILLTLAGDGAIRLEVEAPELRLRDVTRPYLAPSKRVPDHST